MTTRLLLSICIYFIFLFNVSPAVEIGDKAPSLNITTWFNGGPIDPSITGKIYIIVFWATWDKFCIEAVPILNRIHKNYKDKDVRIIAIAQELSSRVGMFIINNNVEYTVGIDNGTATTRKYMKGHSGIPKAFITDKNSQIIWIGNPLFGIERILDKILKGNFKKENINIQKLEKELKVCLKIGDFESAMDIINDLISLSPYNYNYHKIKIDILKYKKKIKATQKAIKTAIIYFIGDPDKIYILARELIRDKNYEFRNPKLALEAVLISIKLSKDTPKLYTLLGEIYSELGMFDKAIMAIKEGEKYCSLEKDKEILEKRLKYYLFLKKIRKNILERDNND